MRHPLILVLALLFACTPAEPPAPAQLTGTLRYLETNQRLEANLRLSPSDTLPNAPTPTLFGSAMAPLPLVGKGAYRGVRNLALPEQISLTAPCPSGDCPVNISFTAPYLDSLPAAFSRAKTLAFPIAATGLGEEESVVVFFEPADRSAPRRLQMIGPTSSGILTLPAKALVDVPAGEYEVYLIKQQLARDSSANLVYSLQTEYFTRSKDVIVRN